MQKPLINFKATLQEFLQKSKQSLPLYHVLSETGPDHNKIFTIGVFVEERLIGKGTGNSKKEAEQQAAEQALSTLKNERLS